MKNSKKLQELLEKLPEIERKKFEYILNFYTEEHVFYNFENLRDELQFFSIDSCVNFSKPVEQNIKELVDNIELSALLSNFQNIKRKLFESEGKSVSDFLLYLLEYTDMPEEKKLDRISNLRKYVDLIKEGYISASEVSEILRNYFSENVQNSNINWQELEKGFKFELIKKIKYNTIFLDNLEEDDYGSSMIISNDLEEIINQIDRTEAFRKQGGIVTKDVTILLLKYVAGEEFEELNHEEIERIKALLKNFNFKTIKKSDIELVKNSFNAIRNGNINVDNIFFIKNIVSNEDALKAYENLPEELKEQVLKVNIIATQDEIVNVMNALNCCKDEEIEFDIEDFSIAKYYLFSKLPKEKREQMIELIKQEPLRTYKKKLGLRYDISFGFELEAEGISEKTMQNLITKNQLEKAINKRQGIQRGILPRWIIDFDGTVPQGLELTSPVLYDKEEDWNSLKDACKFLTSVGGNAGANCGGHIHLGIDVLGINEEAWRNLLKIWSASESIIYKISNTPFEKPREKTLFFAGPTKPIVDEMLETGSVKINNFEDVKKLADYYTRRGLKEKTKTGRNKGLNLCPIAEGKQNTIEFRIPNGNLDYIEIQRTAELYARMMEVSRIIAEEPEYKREIFEKLQKGKTEEERMIYLLDLLFDKTLDKALFYKRYFSQPEELRLSGEKYSDIVESEIDVDERARYKWKGFRE